LSLNFSKKMGKPLFDLSVVVATRNRLPELRRMLRSLEAQSVDLREVIIVDGSDIPLGGCFNEFENLPIRYVRCFPPSSTKQRNEGIKTVSPESEYIGFLDDDVILEPGALVAMREFWQSSADNTGGAALNMTNHPPLEWPFLKTSRLAEILGLYSSRKGAVMRSGFQTMIGPVQVVTHCDWLPTTAVVWRKRVFESFRFDEWFDGYSYLEDLDFSYRVGKEFTLVLVPGSRYSHFPGACGRGNGFAFGLREVRNRLYFVGKNPELSRLRCVSALSVRSLMNLGLAIRRKEAYYLQRFLGNLTGLARAAVSSGRGRRSPGPGRHSGSGSGPMPRMLREREALDGRWRTDGPVEPTRGEK